jgi:hypothetical protein
MRQIVEEIHRTHAPIADLGSYSNTLANHLTSRLQTQTNVVYAEMAKAYSNSDA